MVIKMISRTVAGVMLVAALGFIFFALGHPEMSFPWSNELTYTIYVLYAAINVLLFVAPFEK